MKAMVLIVEDEKKLSRLLEEYLSLAGYDTMVLEQGDRVVEWVQSHPVDLVLLDLMLPDKGGLEVCRELRTFSQVPIIMTTARVEEISRLVGLAAGADDYICKPYYLQEVVARVKTVLKRIKSVEDMEFISNRLVLDRDNYVAQLDGVIINLTRVEFRLLATLINKSGKVCLRETLINGLYDDYRVVSDRTVDTHVKNLRKKFAAIVPGTELIRSVYGVGYVMDMPN